MNKGFSKINIYKTNEISVKKYYVKDKHIRIKKRNYSSLLSEKTIDHINSGDYTINSSKFVSGGHGEDSFKIMEEKKIKYEINIVYNNGVRVGNIINSKSKKFIKGNKHTWFPKEWTKETIIEAGSSILPNFENIKDGKYIGICKSVKITVIVKECKIKTMYPSLEQNGGVKNDKKTNDDID